MGYECFGCRRQFRAKRALHTHQGEFWPNCPPVVDNSVDMGVKGLK